MNAFRDGMIETFQLPVSEGGAGKNLQDAKAMLSNLEEKMGLEKITEAMRFGVIASDPAIIDAMQALYESGELTFPPSKKYRDFAEKVKTGVP